MARQIGAVTLGGLLPLLLATGGTANASTGLCGDPTLGGTFYCTDGVGAGVGLNNWAKGY
jgi:hypothetical protein